MQLNDDGHQAHYGAGAVLDGSSGGGRRMWWLIPAILAVAAVLGFGIVTLLLQHKSSPSNHDAMAPATVAPNPSQTPAAGTSPSATTAATSSTSSAPSSSSHPDFPAGTSLQCAPTQGSGLLDNPQPDAVRMLDGAGSSCAFLGATRNEVLAKLLADPTATSFSVAPYSPARKRPVPLECSVSGGFTYCAGGESAKLYVRNP